jgi:predicted metal-binding membrane protein
MTPCCGPSSRTPEPRHVANIAGNAVSRDAGTPPRCPFLGSYVAVWTLVGLAVYALYRPHGTAFAGALTIAAGPYELTPLKRRFRRHCRESIRTGFQFGLSCVGSRIGLMLMLLALGLMSVTWMSVIAILIVGQKLLPPRAPIDVPLALAIVALGILVVLAPSAVPALTQPM